jgi:hypothetical protein
MGLVDGMNMVFAPSALPNFISLMVLPTIRLREITLGYSIPASLLSKTPFGNVRISVSGRNLWWSAPNMLEGLNFDPEASGLTSSTNVQGFEYGAAPTTRRYGVNLNVTF